MRERNRFGGKQTLSRVGVEKRRTSTTAGSAGASMSSAVRVGDLALFLEMTPLRLLRTHTFED